MNRLSHQAIAQKDGGNAHPNRLTVRKFAAMHAATLMVLVPLTMFIGDPNSPYWMALTMAYFTSRPVEGYQSNQTRILVVCCFVAIALSFVSIPIHLLFPDKAAEWYIGPSMTVVCLSLAGCARYIGQRIQSSSAA